MSRRQMVIALLSLCLMSCGQTQKLSAPDVSRFDVPSPTEVGRPTMDEMIEIINEAYAAHPDSNLQLVQAEIWTKLRSLPKTTRTAEPEAVASSSIFRLSYQELLLLASKPWYAVPTNTCRTLAVNETDRQWPSYSTQYQNRPDAFRHAYWNILMCRRINEEWARLFSTAHESDQENGLLDAQMDLNNNGIGRAIWRTFPGRSEAGYSELVKTFRYTKVTSFSGAVPYLIYLAGS